uniref:Neuregulin 2b n=1 Tax=Oncorhynchus kisutch TaxID=8019 RepID=A0A8C7J854_ONCKI
MRLDPVHFSMLVIGVSFACYAPSLNSLQDQAYRSAVVIEGEVRSSPENVSRDPYSVNVKVLDVWPVNSGGLEREQLVTVGDFGSEASCTTVEENHRYIFFMDPTGEPLVFKASFAPLDASGTDLKKDVESVLCEDCGKLCSVSNSMFSALLCLSLLPSFPPSLLPSLSHSLLWSLPPLICTPSSVSQPTIFSSLRPLLLWLVSPIRCPNDYTGDRCQKSVMAGFYKHLGIEFMEAEELYQRRVLTITGICVALLVVGMVCVAAYCKTKKQRKKMHGHLNQNQCVEQPNRMLANGPNHPGPGPEEIPMVDYISKNAPTTECSIIQHGPEESVNFSGSRMSTRSHHSSTVSHNSRHEERTWSIDRTDSMNSDFQSGALSSSVGTSKCSSPTCMEARAQRAAYWGCSEGASLQYGDSYDSLRDSPHSDRYVSALTTPARLSPVEFHYPPLSPQVPTFHITSPNTCHALALPPAAAAYHREDDQPLLRFPQPRRPRQPYLTESTGSLPSSPYRLPDDEAYETTQEYASSREPIRSRRRPRRNRLNGHFSQRAMGLRDYSSQSFSQSEEEEEEEEGHGESTPFLSMQNMNMEPCERGFCSLSNTDSSFYRPLYFDLL